MKYVNGLYTALVLMLVAILINTTIFDDEYSGVFTYICLGLFILGTAYFVNARLLKKSEIKSS